MDDNIIKFHGTITFCKYYNNDSSWGVYEFYTTEDIPFYSKSTDDKSIKFSTITGKVQELVIGAEYYIKAIIKEDKKYGKQYEPISVYAEVPKTREQSMLFLKSLISENIATNLLNEYPDIVNDVISGKITDIDLTKVRGVGEFTWKKIKEVIINNYLISDIIIMLKPIGVTYTMIKKLLSEIPNPTLLKQEIEENPYTLCRISGLGFKRIDDFALKLKPEKFNSKERLIAFIKYYFTELGENAGNTWCSTDILKRDISNNVPECLQHFEWLLENNEFLHVKNNKIGLKHYYDVEMKIYNLLLEKSKKETNFKFDENITKLAIEQAEEEQGFEYVDEQINVIKNTINRTVSFITGKAGCGKTSLIRALIKIYCNNNYTVTASALSAMASQRITEASGYPASTIHRTLGCQGFNNFLFNKDNKLITNVVFLDEGSMVNAQLFLDLLQAVDDNSRIIISGDYRQLPPIGYGNIFSDLIELFSDSLVSELTKPMRQAEKSGIIVDANLIQTNKNPIKEPKTKIVHGELKDMYYMFRDNRQSLFDIAIKTYLKSIETDGIDNVVIAVPRRKDCLNSAFELNIEIQDKLLGNEKKSIQGYENSFKLGAKVMQTINDYDKNVFNGEIGYITNIGNDTNNENGAFCEVTFKSITNDNTNKDDKIVRYNKKELAALDLAYANTVHKLQGSGKKTVIGIIDETHYQLLDSCMLYTMITRAKKRCLLLAEPKAFLKCIRTSHNKRNTWLSLL